MSNQRKRERQLEIEQIREEAKEAARTGKPRNVHNYNYMSKYQWEQAYDTEVEKQNLIRRSNRYYGIKTRLFTDTFNADQIAALEDFINFLIQERED